jgi:hypothetical protein
MYRVLQFLGALMDLLMNHPELLLSSRLGSFQFGDPPSYSVL